jgi:hypothetical protein
MNQMIKLGAAAALLGAASMSGCVQAAESATETRTIDARVVRVKLDGVVDLRIRQGRTASLVLSGDPRLLGKTTTRQRGDTLNIDTETRSAGLNFNSGEGLRAELVLPELREVASDGVGSTMVSGFAGERIDISLDGAGSMSVTSDYRFIAASLGGVGSLKVHGINSETIELNLHGAGYVTLSGRSKSLRAELGGLGGLDARQCAVESVALELSGLGNATVYAQNSASMTLSGMGSVTVFGKPANRKVVLDGLGKVTWR